MTSLHNLITPLLNRIWSSTVSLMDIYYNLSSSIYIHHSTIKIQVHNTATISYANDVQLNLTCADNITEFPTIASVMTSNSLISLGKLASFSSAFPPPQNRNNTITFTISQYPRTSQTSICLDNLISNVTRSIDYHLHSLRIVLRSTNTEIAALIASTFIPPILDCCNFIFHLIPNV